MNEFFNAYANIFNTEQCSENKKKFQNLSSDIVSETVDLISDVCSRTMKMTSNITNNCCNNNMIDEYFCCAKDNINSLKKYAVFIHENIEKKCSMNDTEMQKEKS